MYIVIKANGIHLVCKDLLWTPRTQKQGYLER
jgi:hypothetical protein